MTKIKKQSVKVKLSIVLLCLANFTFASNLSISEISRSVDTITSGFKLQGEKGIIKVNYYTQKAERNAEYILEKQGKYTINAKEDVENVIDVLKKAIEYKKIVINYVSSDDYFNSKYMDKNIIGYGGEKSNLQKVDLGNVTKKEGFLYALYDSSAWTGKAFAYSKTDDEKNVYITMEEINFLDFYTNHLSDYVYKNKKEPILIYNQILYAATQDLADVKGILKLKISNVNTNNTNILKKEIRQKLIDSLPLFFNDTPINNINISRADVLNTSNYISTPLVSYNYLEETYAKQLFMQMLSDYMVQNGIGQGYVTFANATDFKFRNKTWVENKYKKYSCYNEKASMSYYKEGTYKIISNDSTKDVENIFSFFNPTVKLLSFAPVNVAVDDYYNIDKNNHIAYSYATLTDTDIINSINQPSEIGLDNSNCKNGLDIYSIVFLAANADILAKTQNASLSGLSDIDNPTAINISNIVQSNNEIKFSKEKSVDTIVNVIPNPHLQYSFTKPTAQTNIFTTSAKYQDMLNSTFLLDNLLYKNKINMQNGFSSFYNLLYQQNNIDSKFKDKYISYLKNEQLIFPEPVYSLNLTLNNNGTESKITNFPNKINKNATDLYIVLPNGFTVNDVYVKSDAYVEDTNCNNGFTISNNPSRIAINVNNSSYKEGVNYSVIIKSTDSTNSTKNYTNLFLFSVN